MTYFIRSFRSLLILVYADSHPVVRMGALHRMLAQRGYATHPGADVRALHRAGLLEKHGGEPGTGLKRVTWSITQAGLEALSEAFETIAVTRGHPDRRLD